jgi:hypothetical protein
MTLAPASHRFRAVSMELAAYLDAHTVEMHILTDTGQSVTVVCPRDSIFAIQKHIGQMRDACPEIATWSEDYRAQDEIPGWSAWKAQVPLTHQQHRSST